MQAGLGKADTADNLLQIQRVENGLRTGSKRVEDRVEERVERVWVRSGGGGRCGCGGEPLVLVAAACIIIDVHVSGTLSFALECQ